MNQRLLSIFALCMFFSIANPTYAVFIGDNTGDLYELDVATNTSTLIGNSGIGAMFDIAQDPTTNILYGITSGGLLASIDTSTGAATGIGGAGAFINGLTFDSSGTLFGSGGTNLYTLDLLSGLASAVGNTGFSSSGDIAFDSRGNLFLSASGGAGGDQLVAVDSLTGVGIAIGDIGFGSVFGLNFEGSTLHGFTLGGLTLDIDTSTGLGTQIATNSIRAFGADGAGGVSVPEPSTLALLAFGLLGLGFNRKMIS